MPTTGGAPHPRWRFREDRVPSLGVAIDYRTQCSLGTHDVQYSGRTDRHGVDGAVQPGVQAAFEVESDQRGVLRFDEHLVLRDRKAHHTSSR
ncbi:MAG: hypothetical protein IH798_05975 [Gemmatimonadetes bacterium]|nr:hypothetical protein [Gemmatimonadota bacterium]